MEDPFKLLGVDANADERLVKRAYRKLALKYHPDVNKDELAEAKFRALREAYELLMGKGGAAESGQRGAPFGGNWEMHDWYWTFSMRQRQRRQNGDAAPVHESAAAQKHRPKVNSQLAGLKQRAAKRQHRQMDAYAAAKRASQCQPPDVARAAAADGDAATSQAPLRDAVAAPARQGNAAAASRLSALLGSMEDSATAMRPAMEVQPLGSLFGLANTLPSLALPLAGTVWRGGGERHVVCSPAPRALVAETAPDVIASSSSEVPSAGSRDGSDAQAVPEGQAPASSGGTQGSGRRFVGTRERRGAVQSQLTGLRRRAALKRDV